MTGTNNETLTPAKPVGGRMRIILVIAVFIVGSSARANESSELDADPVVLRKCTDYVEYAKGKVPDIFKSNDEWHAFLLGCVVGAGHSNLLSKDDK